MSSYRRVSASPSFASAAVALLLALLAPAAADAGVSDLGSVGLGTVAVDNTHRHVFVSGPAGNVVDVFDFSGNEVATIPDLPGAYGMAIGSKSLYVTERPTGAIVEIDLATLAVAGSPLATGLEDPRWLALAGGKLWVTVGGQFGELGSIDLTTHVVQEFSVRNGTVYEPQLAAALGHPYVLLMADEGESPGRIYRLNIAGAKPRVVKETALSSERGSIQGIAVSPNGKRVISASWDPYDFEELTTRSLTPDGVRYPGAPGEEPSRNAIPSAVAVSGRKADLLATGLCGTAGPDIFVQPIGQTTPIFEATTVEAPGRNCVDAHGLAMSEDGRSVFAAYMFRPAVGPAETMIEAFQVPSR